MKNVKTLFNLSILLAGLPIVSTFAAMHYTDVQKNLQDLSDSSKAIAELGAMDMWAKYGVTPLGWAVNRGNRPIVTDLLKQGADINAKAKDGRTPIMFAVDNADLDMVILLLAHHPDLTIPDKKGKTVLDKAKKVKGKFSGKNQAEMADRVDRIILLLEHAGATERPGILKRIFKKK